MSLTKRSTSRRTSRRAQREEQNVPAPAPEVPAPLTLGESWPDEPDAARPMALSAEQQAATQEPATTPDAAVPAWATPSPAPRAGRATDRYAEDIPVAILSAVIAGSAFLPWYKGPRGFSLDLTAWETGTWGPIILFLAAASVILVVLRRLGVAVSLPVDESLFHEGVGWVCLAGSVVKSRFRPGTAGLLGLSYGLWIAIGAAVLLIIVAGRMSPHGALVLRPGWFRGRAGALGAALLLVAGGGAAAFATMNDASVIPQPPSRQQPGVVTGRMPECAQGYELPAGVKPIQAGENPCQVQLQSEKPAAEVLAAFKANLTRAGATFQELRTAAAPSLVVTKPRCHTIIVIGNEPGSVAVIAFDVCGQQSPAPTASPTRT